MNDGLAHVCKSPTDMIGDYDALTYIKEKYEDLGRPGHHYVLSVGNYGIADDPSRASAMRRSGPLSRVLVVWNGW